MRKAKSRGSVRERWPIFERPEPLDPSAVYRDDPPDQKDRQTADEKKRDAEALFAAKSKLAEERADETIDVVLLPTEELAAHRSEVAKHWKVPEESRDWGWVAKWRAHQRDLVKATVRGVYGIFVDDQEIRQRDAEAIVTALEAADALADVTWAALRAQALTREEAGFLGPSERTEQARS